MASHSHKVVHVRQQRSAWPTSPLIVPAQDVESDIAATIVSRQNGMLLRR
jgi:hypothetical protein